MKEQEIKTLLENYFQRDYIINNIEVQTENKPKPHINFRATLKEGHPKEAMFFCSNISMHNIYWDKMSFDAMVLVEDLPGLESALEHSQSFY